GGRGPDFGMGGVEGMGGRTRSRRPRAHTEPESGPAAEHELEVTFMTAARGGTERLRLSSDGKAKTIDVTIPKGIANGSKLRIRAGPGACGVILRIKIGYIPAFGLTALRAVVNA